MGDILLTLPALLGLQQKHGQKPILVTGSKWQALKPFLPANVKILQKKTDLLFMAKELKRNKPKSVFELQGKIISLALASMIAAPQTEIYKKRNLKEQFQAISKRFPIKLSDPRPVWKKYAEVCGVEPLCPEKLLVFPEDYEEQTYKLLEKCHLEPNKYILIHPFASKPGKVLPDSLVESLIERSPLPVVIMGVSDLEPKIKADYLDFRNSFSLNELPGIMMNAAAVISSDSGPMHLARAVGVPLAAVFLQTDPALGFSPVESPNNLVLSEPLPCKPCSLHGGNSLCPLGHFDCRKVDEKAYADKIFEFLDKFL